MVICIPTGDDDDQTRPKKQYDRLYEYLVDCGIPEMESQVLLSRD